MTNVIVENTFLGIERGHLTFLLSLHGQKFGIGFGGVALTGCDGPFPAGLTLIKDIIEVVGCGCWEKLPGSYCRVEIEDQQIISLGHIVEDNLIQLRNYRIGGQGVDDVGVD